MYYDKKGTELLQLVKKLPLTLFSFFSSSTLRINLNKLDCIVLELATWIDCKHLRCIETIFTN